MQNKCFSLFSWRKLPRWCFLLKYQKSRITLGNLYVLRKTHNNNVSSPVNTCTCKPVVRPSSTLRHRYITGSRLPSCCKVLTLLHVFCFTSVEMNETCSKHQVLTSHVLRTAYKHSSIHSTWKTSVPNSIPIHIIHCKYCSTSVPRAKHMFLWTWSVINLTHVENTR